MAELHEEDELKGLPRVIQTTLKKHPKWRRTDRNTVVCEGPDCDWKKPSGKSVKQGWLAHQTNVLQVAIGKWYFDDEPERE